MSFLLHRILFKPLSLLAVLNSQVIKQTLKSSLKVFLEFKNVKNSIACDYYSFPQIFPHVLIQKFIYISPISFQEVIFLFPFTVQLPKYSGLHSSPLTASSLTETLHCSTKTAPRSHQSSFSVLVLLTYSPKLASPKNTPSVSSNSPISLSNPCSELFPSLTKVFFHSNLQQICTEHLLHASHCGSHWRSSGGEKVCVLALIDEAQLVGCHSTKQKVASLVSSQGNQFMCLSHIHVSIHLPPFPSL